MPLIANSTYTARGFFKNAHVNTIYPAFFRNHPEVNYTRQRLETTDGDFIDIDWSRKGNKKLLIALHGLEGNAERHYIVGMIHHFNQRGWDGLGINFRGCSGTPNRLLRSYHIGETGDLRWIIKQVLKSHDYEQIALVGYSLGGNVLMKYLGEQPSAVPEQIIGGVAFSVPCDVGGSNLFIDRWYNRHYLNRFLSTLNKKIIQKAKLFPDELQLPEKMPHNFYTFDDAFTAPLHGFKNAEHYWSSSSSLRFIPDICRPTLLVNAQDDTFLSPSCFPHDLAKKLPNFYLETPRYGGHVGFVNKKYQPNYWTEIRAFDFLNGLI
jgi:predicted alpha/beta-fold hydrolase